MKRNETHFVHLSYVDVKNNFSRSITKPSSEVNKKDNSFLQGFERTLIIFRRNKYFKIGVNFVVQCMETKTDLPSENGHQLKQCN